MNNPDPRPDPLRSSEPTKSSRACVVALFLLCLGLPTLGGVAWLTLTSRGVSHGTIQRIRSDFATILSAAAMFHEEYKRAPASLEELLFPPPRTDGKVVRYLKVPPRDPWSGEPYHLIIHPDGSWVLMSYGADQKPGGSDHDADLRSDEMHRAR